MFKLFIFCVFYAEFAESFKPRPSAELQRQQHVPLLGAYVDAFATVGAPSSRIGYGYDIHRVVAAQAGGKPLKLGGVDVPDSPVGVLAHSDGDVVLHAICDAILGALGKGDIGDYFPDSDARFANLSSVHMLNDVLEMMARLSFSLVNVDVCIILEAPRIGALKEAIRENLNLLLGYDALVNVKAKTNERLDALGSGAAVACHAVALLNTRV